ncbi:MAG: DUF4340 domain-containing protein [Acidobacteriaceae bacterium]|nr:DUF4340 domain-containing protein [Acidobacteriaceae bacterium]
MKQRNLLIAAVLLAALSGGVWWAKRHPQSTESSNIPASPKLTDIPQAQIKQIDLKKKDGTTVVLQNENGRWAITAPESLPADQDAANNVASTFNPVSADNIVEDKPKDLSQYGLTNPTLTVTVIEKDGKSQQLLLGDDVPAGSLVYARANSDPKVYAVASSIKTSLDKSVNDLRDKRLLTFDSNRLTRIELVSAKSDIEFGKNNQNDWQILKPQPYRADSFQVEELLRKLTEAKMDLSASADDAKKLEAAYASGQPVGTVKVSDAAGTQSLDIRKNKDDYYAKSSVVNGVYKISADLGKEIDKPLDDYRNKKIFDFGFADPTKIDLQQGGSEKAYSRSGSDWKLGGQTMDPGSVQAFIDKLRDLSATKFVTTGFTTPAFSVTVTSNDGKRVEKAEFAKTADGYIVQRENEPSLYQVDGKAADDILGASKAIKPAASAKK